MKYLATIKNAYDSTSQMCRTLAEAEQWLDENNNNMEHTTFIDTYDDNWRKIDSIVYTKTKE